MAYRVIIDRGITVAGVKYPHGSVIDPANMVAEAKDEVEAAKKAGYLEDSKLEAAVSAAGKAASTPAKKEG